MQTTPVHVHCPSILIRHNPQHLLSVIGTAAIANVDVTIGIDATGEMLITVEGNTYPIHDKSAIAEHFASLLPHHE